jgi:ribosome biogenesis GTPase
MAALVVVNKCDLETPAAIEESVASLRANGVLVLLTAARVGRGIDELRGALAGKFSAMAGQSGVGKSSLVNALDPQFAVRVSEVSTLNHKGRHTTTASRLYALAGGGYLADTPGIRELALFDDEGPGAVASVFPEIEEASGLCRFRGCSHSHEPGCAVKELVASGAIDEDRYRNFLKLNAGGES